MPDMTSQPLFDSASQAAQEYAAAMPRQTGLTHAQLQAAASVLAHVHARPHPVATALGGGSGQSSA